MFLPASGRCNFGGEISWEYGGDSIDGAYWSSKQYDEYDAYSLYFDDGGGIDVSHYNKSDTYSSCRLVRE